MRSSFPRILCPNGSVFFGLDSPLERIGIGALLPATRGDKEHALRCTVGFLLMCYIHIASHDVFIALAGISRANRELYMTELVTLLELCRFICRFVVGGGISV